MPDFVDVRTSVVWGTSWKNYLPGVFLSEIIDELFWLDPDMNAGQDLVLVVAVANPRHIAFKADVILGNGDLPEGVTGVINPGLDQFRITIPSAVWEDGRQGLKVNVEFSPLDGSKEFEPYTAIPYIRVSETVPNVPGAPEAEMPRHLLRVMKPVKGGNVATAAGEAAVGEEAASAAEGSEDIAGSRMVPVGERVELLAAAESGYTLRFFGILYRSQAHSGSKPIWKYVAPEGINSASFSMPASDVDVSAEFIGGSSGSGSAESGIIWGDKPQ
jgi:hypothetical protein